MVNGCRLAVEASAATDVPRHLAQFPTRAASIEG